MKKTALFLSLIIVISLLFGCKKEEKESPELMGQMDGLYYDFEEAIDSATDIVKAKCIDISFSTIDHPEKVYEFQVEERFLGEDTTDTIFVYCYYKYRVSLGNHDKGYSFMFDTSYETGETYYLILRRDVSVYYEHDHYRDKSAQIKIPANNIHNSTMYQEPLTEHSDISILESEQDFENYIVNYLESHPNPDRPLYSGIDYVKSDDLETIVNDSDFVMKIKVGEIEHEFNDNIAFYNCTVTSCLKGDVEEDSRIIVKFVKKDVLKGWTYIVTATESISTDKSSRCFMYSAKDSVYSIFREFQIRKYLTD